MISARLADFPHTLFHANVRAARLSTADQTYAHSNLNVGLVPRFRLRDRRDLPVFREPLRHHVCVRLLDNDFFSAIVRGIAVLFSRQHLQESSLSRRGGLQDKAVEGLEDVFVCVVALLELNVSDGDFDNFWGHTIFSGDFFNRLPSLLTDEAGEMLRRA